MRRERKHGLAHVRTLWERRVPRDFDVDVRAALALDDPFLGASGREVLALLGLGIRRDPEASIYPQTFHELVQLVGGARFYQTNGLWCCDAEGLAVACEYRATCLSPQERAEKTSPEALRRAARVLRAAAQIRDVRLAAGEGAL